MRDFYPDCYLIGDNSPLFSEVCKSLRFSTHCNYKVLSDNPPFDVSNYVHMEWEKLTTLNIESLLYKEKSLIISCYKDVINFDNLGGSYQLKGLIEKYIFAIKSEMDVLISEDNSDDGIEKRINTVAILESLKKINNISQYFESGECWLAFDFLLDFEGKINFLGGVSGELVSGCESYKLINHSLHEHIYASIANKSGFGVGHNIIFTLKIISDDGGLSFKPELKVNRFMLHWSCYRATGINVPLIIVQNLLKRKIKTFYFVEPEYINFDISKKYPRYNFNFDKIYFDLDETLMWKGQAMLETIGWLKWFQKNQYSLVLITRHEHCIITALANIGLSEQDFVETIRVYPEQKKSSFISGSSIFIDNEFPQRLDVHLNSKIPSLDVDQIDFLTKH